MRARTGATLYSNENGWTTATHREVDKAYKQDTELKEDRDKYILNGSIHINFFQGQN